MEDHEHQDHQSCAHCCPSSQRGGLSRRTFMAAAAGGALAVTAMRDLAWAEVAAVGPDVPMPKGRRALVVKPVLVYAAPERREQTSWRSWGGIQTQQDAEKELGRISREIASLKEAACFPVEFLPAKAVRSAGELASEDTEKADVVLLYAAGGPADLAFQLVDQGKHVIVFVRHRSGPVSLWYEVASPILLRERKDTRARQGLTEADVVVDSLDEVLWRLRALGGLANTRGCRILAIGGASGWSTPDAPQLAEDRFALDIQAVPYEELGKLIQAARQDSAAVALARERAEAYLATPETLLETKRDYVDNAFLLDQVFRKLMQQADCRAITINGCMGTIMPMAQTTACLTLSTLNDDGYLAFCESDFVVIPSGILLEGISGKPVFLNDPTYPHDGIITLAHCTGPRKMDGAVVEPARILTHFESDYGAAPKVEMRKGQMTTNLLPAFDATRWVGVRGEIVDAPFLDICRDQIDICFDCDSAKLAERMPGFHWMTGYGDYTKEIGYALGKTGIAWELLTA